MTHLCSLYIGFNEGLSGQKVIVFFKKEKPPSLNNVDTKIYIEVKILDNTSQWREDPRPLAAPCWGGDCLSNLSILPSPGVHLSKSVHMDTQGWKGQTRTLRRFSVCREEKIHRDIGCRFLLMQTTMWYFSLTFNQFKLHMKLVQHSQNFLSDTVFHATAFTFSGHSRGPNNR